MKAKLKDWIGATENLMARRKSQGICKPSTSESPIYTEWINLCGYGNSVLDVGCGSQALKFSLRNGTKYIGLDAFPIDGVDCIHSAIEDLKGWSVDTVVAFAVLDNCRDFKQACEVMKRTANQNVMILTGIGIDVDEFHTFRLEMSDFDEAFKDMNCTYKKELRPKVWLLNYQK